MKIKDLFDRDIFRPINGVVKADQVDDASVWQELDEFVVTRELDQHLRHFVAWYLEAVDQGKGGNSAGKMGVWISGFFGSGKSHLLKVLSYLLRNRTHALDGQQKAAVEFFRAKMQDAMFFGDIQRAVASNTDVVLFNIDSKADHRSGRDLILRVFLKVLNELQGFSGDHPHIAHLERHLQGKGKLQAFHEAYKRITGTDWLAERDAYQFNRDEVVQALCETLGQSGTAADKWIDGAEDNFSLTVENFCRWVKEYLEGRGPLHRLVFLVDEVGQFIGADSHLMLNLQTITEELGTICRRRAWVCVTSQEDMDTVLGDMNRTRRNDFSKIQGRFFPPLSLSSANVDEVIQARLLAKRPAVLPELAGVFAAKGDILKHQLTFRQCGMTFRPFKDGDDFVRNYPFAPYQFQLVQKVFEAIRKAGATGMHLARGERSMLDAFQSAAKSVSVDEVGILVPLYEFYPSIESFLDTSVKKTIDQAETNPSLQKQDTLLLQVLFLVRYVEEFKSNIDNLVTLCIDRIDADRLALKHRIEESLARLEKETLISRSGENHFFLTNEERDIGKEIKQVELTSGEEARLLGDILFEDVLKGRRKYRYRVNKMDFTFNRLCDLYPVGNRVDGALLVSVITPLADEYDRYEKARCLLESGIDGGHVLVRLENDDGLGRELRTLLQTEKYLARKNDGTLGESTRRILRDIAEENRQRRERLVRLLADLFSSAQVYAVGQPLKVQAGNAEGVLEAALEYLIQNTFSKMGYLKRLSPEPAKEIQAVLRSNDIGREQLLFEQGENNPDALEDLRSYVELASKASRQTVLHDLIEKRYALRPYGWPEDEVLLLLARLVVLGEIVLTMDGTQLATEKVYDVVTMPARRRKIVVHKRHTSDPKALSSARNLGKTLFAEMGPDGEEGLASYLKNKIRDWQDTLATAKPLADNGDYPGKEVIDDGLALIKRLLAFADSYKFIEQFNTLKPNLEEFADGYHDVSHFYGQQKPAWDRLRKARDRFQKNRLDLERHNTAGPALKRMREILAAPSPYALIQEGDGLIAAVVGVHEALVSEARQKALTRIDGLTGTLTQDIAKAGGDATLRSACVQPLEALKAQVQQDESVAHIAQAEVEAVRMFDAGVVRVEEFVRKQAEKPGKGNGAVLVVAVKKQRVVKPADLAQVTYLETQQDVDTFLDALRRELEKAIADNERIQIR
jgi:hypothetical protein